MTRLINFLAVLLTVCVIALSADLFRKAGLVLYTEQYLAGLLAIALPLVYLQVPATGERKRAGPVPWYDLAAALAGFLACGFAAVRFPELSDLITRQPWDGLGVAIVLLLLLLEGLRRTSGLPLVITAATFFVLALVGSQLPEDLAARSIPLPRLTYFAVWDSTAALGLPLKIVSTIVVIYALFGNVLFKSGGSSFFTDISMALMGRRRGGPAKIAILGSSLFGTISGSTVSNVLTVGVVTIPLMKRAGFQPYMAGAVEAAASTGGQLMPPVMGIAAFVMAEFLQVPYSAVALAAAIPAILFYVALFIQVDLEAARRNIQPVPEDQIPALSAVMKAGWYFPIPFVVLVYALFVENYEADVAGLLATGAALAFGIAVKFRGRRIGITDIFSMLRDTGLSVLDLFMIGAAAGIIIGTLNYSGLGFSLTLALLKLAGENIWGLLILAAIASIILGMGMPTVGVYILLATLIAPALVKMNISPMAAHMFIMYYGCLSMITPPVAIGAFAAANLAGADPMRTGFEAMRLGWTVFVVPFLFVFSGTLLMQGGFSRVAVDFAAAVAGVWFFSAAMMGYSVRPLGLGSRLVYGIAGLCFVIPLEAFEGGRWMNLAAVVIAAALFIWERLRSRSAPAAHA